MPYYDQYQTRAMPLGAKSTLGEKKISLFRKKQTWNSFLYLWDMEKKNLEMASKVSCGNLVSVLAQNLCWTGKEQRILAQKGLLVLTN